MRRDMEYFPVLYGQAIGNVTGAMVFQGSMITAIGIMMTDWQLNTAAYLQIRLKKRLTSGTLLARGRSISCFSC